MYLKVIKAGDQYEIYRYEQEPIETPKRSRRGVATGPRRAIKRTFANSRRARKNFIRLVRSNLTGTERPAFLTLTMRDIVPVSVAYSCLKGFFGPLRDFVGQDLRYIAVPEFQKRGAVHFHILVWGLPQEIVEHERKNRILQNIWALGFVDILQTDGSPKLAGYLGKYMSKSMLHDDIGFSKAYTCSRNIVRPMSFNGTTLSSIPQDFWDGDNVILTEREYEVPWLGACHYQLLVKRTDHGNESDQS